MGKVDFKLNDSLLRRQPGVHAKRGRQPAPPTLERGKHPPAAPLNVVAEPAEPTAGVPDRQVSEQRAPGWNPTHRDRGRPASVQTSLLLPARLWDQLRELAREVGGLATPSRLLIDILAGGPQSVQEAADELEEFLALPVEETALGEPWEERNIRVPIELRRRLDEHRRTLIDAGVRHATRAHLVAATVLLRGPTIAEDARALMAERRAQAFRDALATELPRTTSG